MAAPRPYNRVTNFNSFQALNPTTPLVGSNVDAELNAVKISLDSIIANLELIQRDDGRLGNQTVGTAQLDSSVSFGIEPPAAWATNTNYFAANTVFKDAKLYLCLESHLSGAFSTDLAAEKWEEIADFVAAVNSATNIGFTPAGTVAATDVQAAIVEVAGDAATALAALAAGDFLVKTAFAAGSAERVVTDTNQVKADWATAGQVKFGVYKTTVDVTLDTEVTAAQRGSLFLIDTTAGTVTMEMPTLASGDKGWWCDLIKTNTGSDPYFIAPPTGTIQSGALGSLAKTRRCIPMTPTRVWWTGTAWVAERAFKGAPVGSCIEYHGATLPVGFEWPNGQTLASASANYPDYYAVNGSSGVTLDRRGRVAAGKDDMGGSSANRLTGASGGLNGDTLGVTGGAETHTLIEAELPTITVTQNAHDHAVKRDGRNDMPSTGGNNVATNLVDGDSATPGPGNASVTSTVTATNNPFGSDDPHNNVQPTIIANFILVVE